MKQLCLAVLLAGQLLFFDCGTAPTMAAGSSATGNAKVSGSVGDGQGNPAAGVTLYLRTFRITARGDSIIKNRTAQSASNGSYMFDSLTAGNYALYCSDSANARSAILQKIVLATDSASIIADLVINHEAVVKGRIVTSAKADLQNMRIVVPGMGITFYPDSQGNYALRAAPRSAYDIGFISGSFADFLHTDISADLGDTVFVNDVQFAKTVSEAQGVENYYSSSLSSSFTVVPVEAQARALLFDDFESALSGGLAHNAIFDKLPSPGGAGSGQWVVRPNADGHIISPAIFPANFDSCIITDGAFNGKSMRIFIKFNLGGPPTGGIGVDICTPRVYYDLSKMTEFSFYAKGTGHHRVVFHTDTVEYGEGEFIYEFTIPTDWQRVSIKNTDLVPKPGSQTEARGVTWAGASRGVTSISFFALTDDTLYMDDIYMFGITTADMVVTSPGNQMP
jgi:hypothetical protein